MPSIMVLDSATCQCSAAVECTTQSRIVPFRTIRCVGPLFIGVQPARAHTQALSLTLLHWNCRQLPARIVFRRQPRDSFSAVCSAPASTSCACCQTVLFPGKGSFGIWLLMWRGERVGSLRAFCLGLGVERSAGVTYSCLELETFVSSWLVVGLHYWGCNTIKGPSSNGKLQPRSSRRSNARRSDGMLNTGGCMHSHVHACGHDPPVFQRAI